MDGEVISSEDSKHLTLQAMWKPDITHLDISHQFQLDTYPMGLKIYGFRC